MEPRFIRLFGRRPQSSNRSSLPSSNLSRQSFTSHSTLGENVLAINPSFNTFINEYGRLNSGGRIVTNYLRNPDVFSRPVASCTYILTASPSATTTKTLKEDFDERHAYVQILSVSLVTSEASMGSAQCVGKQKPFLPIRSPGASYDSLEYIEIAGSMSE